MHPIEWQQQRIPQSLGVILDGLRLSGSDAPAIQPPDSATTYFLHRNQLTLIARHLSPDACEPWYQANDRRLSRLRETTEEALTELRRAGIETVLLKGFARASEYLPDPLARMHYDVDLYSPRTCRDAASVLTAIGYQPIDEESDTAGHLAPLARPSAWKWRDDFFDLETAVHIELHYALWVPQIEGFSFAGLDEFWLRREIADGLLTLSRHDTLAYRCLHLLRHLLRGDLRAAGVYEIAYFLHQNQRDDRFWTVWQHQYGSDLQRAQGVCFALAQRWFACGMHTTALDAIANLPPRALHWMERSAASPVESFFTPSKHELGLHFALLDSRSARFRVALRRLFPVRHTTRLWEDRGAYISRLASRAIYHAKALLPTLSRLPIIRR